MAVYFLRGGHISRGKGARATRAAAYRAGERIRDERTSEIYDHSSRRDVAHKEVVLPADLAGREDMAWTQNRATLWNAAEHAGLRRNSRLAREWLVFLPSELNAAERTQLARTFALELADRYRCAVDVAIHQPRPGADPRNHHAHLLMTVRDVGPEGFGARIGLEMQNRERHAAGMGSSRQEYLAIRARWAELANEALERAGLPDRVDHRSLKKQGIDREPTLSIPEKVFYAERKYGPSAAGDAIRARHRERLEARKESPEALARVIERQARELKEGAREHFKRRQAQPQPIRWGSLTRAERNALNREKYEARRVLQRQDPAFEAKRREASRLAARDRQEKNPEGVRAARRRWCEANRDRVNRNQREYRQARAEQAQHAKHAEHAEHASQTQHAQQAKQAPKAADVTAEQSARNWQAHRAREGPGPTAEESARAWREQREHGIAPPTPAPSPRTHGSQLDRSSEPSTEPGRHPDLGL